MKDTYYLIDGSGYIFRAFYAVASLSTKTGFPTNALFGFTKMMVKFLREVNPQHIAVVFDAGRITFRNEMYEPYKANRSEAPPELVPQFPYFRELARAMGLAVIELPGFEADDVIATLTKRLVSCGHEVKIITADKDLMQLVSDSVSLLDTMKGKESRAAEVKEKFGVMPSQVVEVLALTGDDSDNIPGVSGVGPKTAAQLVEKFGTTENILANLAAIEADASIRGRQKLVATLREQSEILRISRKLVEVVYDAPVVLPVPGVEPQSLSILSDDELGAALKRTGPTEALSGLASQFEFESILGDLKRESELSSSSSLTTQVVTKAEFSDFKKIIEAEGVVAFDLETTSLDVKEAKIVGAAFSAGEGKTFYLPLRHDVVNQCDESSFLQWVANFLDGEQRTIVAHNIKYDLGVLAEHGITIRGPLHDTMIQAYLLNPDDRSFSLESLAEQLLHRSSISFESLVEEGSDFSAVPIDAAAAYAGEDAFYCFSIFELLLPQLKDQGLIPVYDTIDMPLVPILSKLERTGIAIDEKHLAGLAEEFSVELEEIKRRVFELAGGEFNMNSPKQLGEVLFDKLGLPTKGLKKTKTGISTDSSVLEHLSSFHELPRELLRYRTIFKLKNTYVDTLPMAVSKKTHRIHTSFHQTSTGTGRLSSVEPNLQNIPIQTKEGRRIREAFVPAPGCCLLSADYSQIELRVLAHLSDDTTLIDTFAHNVDIHTRTAREILHIPESEPVTAEQRRIGKTMNFGIIYGMSAFRLSKELEIPVHAAQSYIDAYFAQYPGVKALFHQLTVEAETVGFVSTLFGRKRMVSSLVGNERDKGFLQRVAINAPIQGTAADLVKLAMVAVDQKIVQLGLKAKLLLQIHDELVLEVDEGEASRVKDVVIEAMQSVATLRVPLLVEAGVGPNWEKAHG